MKIKRITDQLVIREEVELQGCHNDCTEYFNKTRDIAELERRAGFDISNNISYKDKVECARRFGYYCYKSKTPKTCMLW